jgi:Family of unknown function (DUF6174)
VRLDPTTTQNGAFTTNSNTHIPTLNTDAQVLAERIAETTPINNRGAMTRLSFISFFLLATVAMGKEGLLRNSHGLLEIENAQSTRTERIQEDKGRADVVVRNEYGYRLLNERPSRPHGSPPRDLQLGTISDPNYDGCDASWKRKHNVFRRNRLQVWKNPTCYSYVLTPICFCVPDDRRPIRIKVLNDTVTNVSFVNDNNNAPLRRRKQVPVPASVPRPTMNDLFVQMLSKCFTGCPNKGAQECSATYDAVHGSFKRLYINPSLLWADDEMVRCRVFLSPTCTEEALVLLYRVSLIFFHISLLGPFPINRSTRFPILNSVHLDLETQKVLPYGVDSVIAQLPQRQRQQLSSRRHPGNYCFFVYQFLSSCFAPFAQVLSICIIHRI